MPILLSTSTKLKLTASNTGYRLLCPVSLRNHLRCFIEYNPTYSIRSGHAGQPSYFFLLVQAKVPKRKTPDDLLEFPIPIPSHKKKSRHSQPKEPFQVSLWIVTRTVLRTLSCSDKRSLWSCFTFDARLRLTRFIHLDSICENWREYLLSAVNSTGRKQSNYSIAN